MMITTPRSMVRKLKSAVRHSKHQLAFWSSTPWRWREAWEDERSYWDSVFREKAGQYWGRLDPSTELDQHVKEILYDVGAKARILDVGAGPLTVLGKRWDGTRLDITATDPLADLYDSILAKYDITPIIRTIKCDGERLEKVFGTNQFDLVYAKNSIDHSYNPLQVIQQMITVAKPGGFVALEHMLNEAEQEKYNGMHQWNLDLQGDRFVIWNRVNKLEVDTAVQPCATVVQARRLVDRWFLVVLQKATKSI